MKDPTEFLARVLEHQGKPYIWGAKGPKHFDCSGLVTFAFKACGGPDWRQTHNSARLWDELEVIIPGKEEAGDLCFYGGPHRITHVMVLMPDARAYGACGGDVTTVDEEMAQLRKAKVQFRSGPKYRPDFRGFRRLPEIVP